MVEHAARGANRDVRALFERAALPTHGLAAREHQHREPRVAPPQAPDLARYLGAQLTRWTQHQRGDFTGLEPHTLQNGQGEGRGLTAARARLPDQVFAFQQHWHGLRLNRRHFLKSELRDDCQQGRGERKFSEVGGHGRRTIAGRGRCAAPEAL